MHSPDGFIDCQPATADIPPGRRAPDQNGCGWIATPDAPKAMDE